MKAILVNLSNEQKALLDHMMLVFCTAIRYSFKRQLEGQLIGDLEKVVAQTSEWRQWSTINRQITKLFKKRKEVNTPGLWLVRRKEVLGIA